MTGTSTTRRTKSRKAAISPTPRTIIDAGKDDMEPLRFDSAEAPERQRIVIAYLDDYPLTMPSEVPPNLALRVMRTARTGGDEAAMLEMLEGILGPEGYERLENWDALTVDNLIALFKVVQRVAMGAMEIPKSGSRSG